MLENDKSEIVNLIEALSLFPRVLKYNLHFPVNWSETMVMARNFGSDEQAFHVLCSFCVFIFCLLFFCQGWCFCDIVKNNDKIFKFQKLLLAVNRIFNLDYDYVYTAPA